MNPCPSTFLGAHCQADSAHLIHFNEHTSGHLTQWTDLSADEVPA